MHTMITNTHCSLLEKQTCMVFFYRTEDNVVAEFPGVHIEKVFMEETEVKMMHIDIRMLKNIFGNCFSRQLYWIAQS